MSKFLVGWGCKWHFCQKLHELYWRIRAKKLIIWWPFLAKFSVFEILTTFCAKFSLFSSENFHKFWKFHKSYCSVLDANVVGWGPKRRYLHRTCSEFSFLWKFFHNLTEFTPKLPRKVACKACFETWWNRSHCRCNCWWKFKPASLCNWSGHEEKTVAGRQLTSGLARACNAGLQKFRNFLWNFTKIVRNWPTNACKSQKFWKFLRKQ